ncbi:hypothetical protein QQ045_012704 [Rhodiola kirilowii]
MATSLVTFLSFRITTPIKSTTQTGSSSSRSQSFTGWLTPIFGWSTDQAYYIDSRRSSSSGSSSISSADATVVQGEDESRVERHRPGGFTEEKARQLRMMTSRLEMSHEKMYHSAIASRLASDFSHRFLDDVNLN